MAQEVVYEPYGGIAVEANRKDDATGLPKPYTFADIPTEADVTFVTAGVLQYQYPLDEYGNIIKTDGLDKKTITTERGLRILVNNTTLTYPQPNVPTFFRIGDPIKFNANSEYTFFDSGTISFGIKVIP